MNASQAMFDPVASVTRVITFPEDVYKYVTTGKCHFNLILNPFSAEFPKADSFMLKSVPRHFSFNKSFSRV